MASRPVLSALKREAALPSGVRGPVERWALRRLAAICLRVAITVSWLEGSRRGAGE